MVELAVTQDVALLTRSNIASPNMQRWILYLTGAVLLVEPVIFRQVKPQAILRVLGSDGALDYLPAWLRASVFAGVYLIEWGPVLAGLLLVHYAHRAKPPTREDS